MALEYKVLGQQIGTSQGIGTYVQIGQVPAGKQWLVSTVSICNRSGSALTYRLAISTSTTPTDSNWLVYGATVPANDTVTLTLGITMGSDWRIMASSSAEQLTFQAFGTEITP
jgi:predicted Abi (CAAX) family protease